jgi:hypothetical protein
MICYMSFPVWCLARIMQWIIFKKVLHTKKLIVLLVVSLILSFLITIVIWGGWSYGDPMVGIFCMPALFAETIVLLFTYLIKNTLLKKWASSS